MKKAFACKFPRNGASICRQMNSISDLLENNRRWSEGCVAQDASYFTRHADGQSPKYLWIGCADSRVPANQVTGLGPGELFVHRNIANMVIHTDLSLLSVLQYAVEVLKVEHVIVCGHYGCGGVKAAYEKGRFGIIDNWLRHIQDVVTESAEELEDTAPDARFDRLCELNVLAQVENLCRTGTVQDAWQGGQTLEIHGWIYQLDTGRLVSLRDPVTAQSHS